MTSEIKLDSSFSEEQSYKESYSKPYPIDSSNKGRLIMLYAREEIPSKLVQIVYRKLDKKYFLEKIDLRREKWFLVCNCNIHKILIKRYLKYVSKEIDSLSTKYDNVIILVDLNSETTEEVMTTFCQIHNLKILINEPTLYKKSNNPTYIALNMTNRPKNFQS